METIPIDYLTFLDETRGMKPSERSAFFDNLTKEQQDEILTVYSIPVSVDDMLWDIRLVQAAEIVEKETDPEHKAKLRNQYDQLEAIYDYEKKKRKG